MCTWIYFFPLLWNYPTLTTFQAVDSLPGVMFTRLVSSGHSLSVSLAAPISLYTYLSLPHSLSFSPSSSLSWYKTVQICIYVPVRWTSPMRTSSSKGHDSYEPYYNIAHIISNYSDIDCQALQMAPLQSLSVCLHLVHLFTWALIGCWSVVGDDWIASPCCAMALVCTAAVYRWCIDPGFWEM